MRKFMQIITEADNVVPFGKKPQTPDQGFTQDEKYRGAGATQASGLTKDLDPANPFHQHVADTIQGIFTSMAAGREISDEQRQKARDIVTISAEISRMTVSSAVQSILKRYNEGRPRSEKLTVDYKNPEQAYMHDDDKYLRDRLRTWDGKELIASNNVIDIYEYVFEHILPLIEHPEEELKKWLKSLETLRVSRDDYEGRIPEFDPNTSKWGGLSAYVHKLLQRWGNSKRNYYGTIFCDVHSGDAPKMEFLPADAKEFDEEKTIRFRDTNDLEEFVRRHEAELNAWWEAEQAKL